MDRLKKSIFVWIEYTASGIIIILPIIINVLVKCAFKISTKTLDEKVVSFLVYEQFILIELNGNLNSRSTQIDEMKHHGVLEIEEQEKFVAWHYNNFDIVLKEGDYFFFVLCPTEASGRTLRLQPGYFHVRKKFL